MTTYRLATPPPAPAAPVLDDAQRRVVDHPGGPLLVLAGPGTGKTTTMVEAIVNTIERGEVSADQVLALTFSRKAAAHLRARITARLGRTTTAVAASTFHSFAWGLVRQHSPAQLYAAPLRLLSAPEADTVLSELLRVTPESVTWPTGLRAAVGTRGFTAEVAAVLSRAREQLMDPADLLALAARADRPEWAAAARVMASYQDITGDLSAIDYADLTASAVIVAAEHRAALRSRYRWIFVDEYQDTDPAQVALLSQLAGDGGNLVVVGDPDQSIYGFRGADVRGILEFPDQFRGPSGRPAPVIALGTTRRFGPALLAASRRVAGRLPASRAVDAREWETFRNPTAVPGAAPGQVQVTTFDSVMSEADHIADLLRRAHLVDNVAWGRMAVLVRSGVNDTGPLHRALLAAGVPVDVASEDLPLSRQPAAVALLEALAAVEALDPDRVESLLTGPLGGLDALEVRALVRRMRAAAPEVDTRTLLLAAAQDPAASHFGATLARARETYGAAGSVQEVLWVLWDGSPWRQRLLDDLDRGGLRSRRAHRDLDAIVALFDAAGRAEQVREATSIATFVSTLAAQEIPSDTLSARGLRGDAVHLLTAHGSKGLEWDLVVVAHVQDGGWPNLRLRNSLLGADQISPSGELPATTRRALLAEERRLFYVAITRATSRLDVTAVRSDDPDGDQPSRFLAEIAQTAADTEITHVRGRVPHPMSVNGLVAELRRSLTDAATSGAIRAAAAARLAELATTRVAGRPLAPAADPATWWGMRDPSRSMTPVRPAEEPVALSASALEGLVTCPAHWFLEREAGGRRAATSHQGFGTIVHAVAERLVSLDEPPEVDDLMAEIDQVWGRLDFRTPWSSVREHDELREVLDRLIRWHFRVGARRVVAVEAPISATITLPDGATVRLTGYPDRLEIDQSGDVVIVDLKTVKANRQLTRQQLAEHPQLGLYQLAVDNGGASDALAGVATTGRSGGAELVQLRIDDAGMPKIQPQNTPVHVVDQVSAAAAAVRSEEFVARPGGHCSFCSFHAICPTKTGSSVLS